MLPSSGYTRPNTVKKLTVFSLVYPEEGSIAETSVKILIITASVLPFLNSHVQNLAWVPIRQAPTLGWCFPVIVRRDKTGLPVSLWLGNLSVLKMAAGQRSYRLKKSPICLLFPSLRAVMAQRFTLWNFYISGKKRTGLAKRLGL